MRGGVVIVSRFYGSLEGMARTSATRRGSAGSGVSAHVRGWDLGARVTVGAVDEHAGRLEGGTRDGFTVYATGGSNGGRAELELLEVQEAGAGWLRVSVATIDDGRSVFYVAPDGRRWSSMARAELEAGDRARLDSGSAIGRAMVDATRAERGADG